MSPPIPARDEPAPGIARAVQLFAEAVTAGIHDDVHAAAAHGLSGSGGTLPHLAAIQKSFGRHDVGAVQAHVGGAAAEGARAMGAAAYASGGSVAFASAPDLHLAAHEAAHVVQQRGGVQLSGGVGTVGDPYERHADAVADRVVAGESAEALLDEHAGGGTGGAPVQRRVVQRDNHHHDHEAPTPATAAPAPGPDPTTAAIEHLTAHVPELAPAVATAAPGHRGRRGAAPRATDAAAPGAPHAAPAPLHGDDRSDIMHPDAAVSAEYSAHAAEVRARYAIPEHGWTGTRLGHDTHVEISDDLRAVLSRIQADPTAVEHIRASLDAFYRDPDPHSRLTPDQVDLPLVLAIATRESGPTHAHRLLEGGTERVSPGGGADSVVNGVGGLDFIGDSLDRMPSSMRGEMAAVPDSQLSARGRARHVHPLSMPTQDVLAAYIEEVRSRQEAFERRLRRHHELTSEQCDALLGRLTRDARRAWTQAAFGSGLPGLLNDAVRRITRALHQHHGDFEAVLADDQVNLNAIATQPSATEGHGLSGHRVRLSMAEAAILDRMLPPELGGEGLRPDAPAECSADAPAAPPVCR